MAALSDLTINDLVGSNWVDHEAINDNMQAIVDRANQLYDEMIYKPGDSVTVGNLYLVGYLTSSRTSVGFNVPLSKPVVASGVSLTRDSYFRIRSNGVFPLGDADTYKPAEVEAISINSSGDSINISLVVESVQNPIVKVKSYYALTSSTTAPGDSSSNWSTDISSKSAGGMYLWRWQKITYDDGSVAYTSKTRFSNKIDSDTSSSSKSTSHKVSEIREYSTNSAINGSVTTPSNTVNAEGWTRNDTNWDSIHSQSAAKPWFWTACRVYVTTTTKTTSGSSTKSSDSKSLWTTSTPKHVATWTGAWNNEVCSITTSQLGFDFT